MIIAIRPGPATYQALEWTINAQAAYSFQTGKSLLLDHSRIGISDTKATKMSKTVATFLALTFAVTTPMCAFAYDGNTTGTIASLHAADNATAPSNQSFRVVLTGLPTMCSTGSTYATADSTYAATVALLIWHDQKA